MEEKRHTISISDKNYTLIKDFCTLNGMKINAYIDDFLSRYFPLEKYGDTPFCQFRMVPKKEEKKEVYVPPTIVVKEVPEESLPQIENNTLKTDIKAKKTRLN